MNEQCRTNVQLLVSINPFVRQRVCLKSLIQPIENGVRFLAVPNGLLINERDQVSISMTTHFVGNRVDGGFDEAEVIWTDSEGEKDEDNSDDNDDD